MLSSPRAWIINSNYSTIWKKVFYNQRTILQFHLIEEVFNLIFFEWLGEFIREKEPQDSELNIWEKTEWPTLEVNWLVSQECSRELSNPLYLYPTKISNFKLFFFQILLTNWNNLKWNLLKSFDNLARSLLCLIYSNFSWWKSLLIIFGWSFAQLLISKMRKANFLFPLSITIKKWQPALCFCSTFEWKYFIFLWILR